MLFRSLVERHDAQLPPRSQVIRRWLNRLGPEAFFQLLEVKRADGMGQNPEKVRDRLAELDEIRAKAEQILAEKQCLTLKDLAVAAVIFGGVNSIARVCEWLVPFMAGAYALGCVVIMIMNGSVLGEAVGLILECAFTPKAAFGGAVGSGMIMALQFGCARGLFSNESGQIGRAHV